MTDGQWHEEERLSTPGRRSGFKLRRLRIDQETFGRFAEFIARYMGSPAFLIWMTAFIAIWLLWNTLLPIGLRFDEQPFILLTLMLSIEAAYSAPLILLAQNRQDDRDRVQIKEDRERTERLIADTEYLAREIAALRIGLGDVVTRDYLRRELRALMDELERDDDGF